MQGRQPVRRMWEGRVRCGVQIGGDGSILWLQLRVVRSNTLYKNHCIQRNPRPCHPDSPKSIPHSDRQTLKRAPTAVSQSSSSPSIAAISTIATKEDTSIG